MRWRDRTKCCSRWVPVAGGAGGERGGEGRGEESGWCTCLRFLPSNAECNELQSRTKCIECCNAVVMQEMHANAENALHGQKPHAFLGKNHTFPGGTRVYSSAVLRSPKWGAKSQQPPLLGGVAASSTRRTLPAEQLVIVEPLIETAPLFHAETTPPYCGCEERAG